MRPQKLILAIIILLLASSILFAQEMKYCEMIGKDVKEVLRVYGKPAHQDLSNPSMKCVFYQSKSSRAAFISDQAGVYQIQVDISYDSEKEAQKSITKFLINCSKNDYKIDTLDISNFAVKAPGVKMNLNLFRNDYLNKFEVKFKADRSEIK
jgi:hypothetical protein